MVKTLVEEKLAIFEPYLGKKVKIKITIVEQGVYGRPVQIIMLAGKLIGVEGNMSESVVSVMLDTMQAVGGDPLPLNFGDTPMPRVEIEDLTLPKEWQ
jgi:hypothetical protein